MNPRTLNAKLVLLLFFTIQGLLLPSNAQQAAKARPETPDHLHANLWMQTSAEYRALCLQTFNQALKEIRQAALAAPHQDGRPVGTDGKPLAVVADLDETILDNAKFQTEVDLVRREKKNDRGYSETRWQRWVEHNVKDVGLVPGAAGFVKEVEKLKVVMVYLSNRPERKRAFTLEALAHNNIDTSGLENASELRLLLKPESLEAETRHKVSDKEPRRKTISERYHVVAYLGDNLSDFPGDFGRTVESRYQRTDEFAELWGSRWFVLPNPVYGDWERVLSADRFSHLKRASDKRFIEDP